MIDDVNQELPREEIDRFLERPGDRGQLLEVRHVVGPGDAVRQLGLGADLMATVVIDALRLVPGDRQRDRHVWVRLHGLLVGLVEVAEDRQCPKNIVNVGVDGGVKQFLDFGVGRQKRLNRCLVFAESDRDWPVVNRLEVLDHRRTDDCTLSLQKWLRPLQGGDERGIRRIRLRGGNCPGREQATGNGEA